MLCKSDKPSIININININTEWRLAVVGAGYPTATATATPVPHLINCYKLVPCQPCRPKLVVVGGIVSPIYTVS